MSVDHRASMDPSLIFNVDLIRRYDKPGPRYTSYPTAVEFREGFGETEYRSWAQYSNEDPIPRPLSLYIHILFFDTFCYYCAFIMIVSKNRAHAA